MSWPRLIPVVTLIESNAVKTQKFKDPKYVGDPVNTVALLSSFEAEELVILDISDSFDVEKPTIGVLSQIIENASMPIAFGGGIQKFEDAKKHFDLGFDKVVIRTGLTDLDLTGQISSNYGAQAVTGCLDYRWHESRSGEIEINNKLFSVEEIPILLRRLQENGVGEIIIQNIDVDGLRSGLETSPLLEIAIDLLDIPVVALGGCSSAQNAADFIKLSRCHSVAASTTFLFRPTRDAVLVNYPKIEDWHKNFEGTLNG
jgi:cyclase